MTDIRTLEEDPEAPDDGKVLIAGILYDTMTGEEADDTECEHERVSKDDDGRDYWFYVCDECDAVVVPTEPDEDGNVTWEAMP